ncbi:MAG: hypothetical protein V7636_135, partial [Actinomycetota bacterium]
MRTDGPLILAYHGVDELPWHADPHGLFVPADVLRRQIRRLRRAGRRFTTLGALASAVESGSAESLVALTFDDGLADNRHQLLPVLQEEGVPATVFVIAGLIGASHPDPPNARLLGPDEITELAASGVEIGSHSVAHRDLTTLSAADVVSDLRESKEILESVVRGPVDVLAYPFGRANDIVRSAAREAGFAAACEATGRGSWEDPWGLPRQDIGPFTGT